MVAERGLDIKNSVIVSLNLSKIISVEFTCMDSALYEPPAMITVDIDKFAITGRGNVSNSNR